MLSRYVVAACRRLRSSRSVAAPRKARSRIRRERLAGRGSISSIAAASSGSTVTCTRGWEDGTRPSVPLGWYTAHAGGGVCLPGGAGRELRRLGGELAHDRNREGVRDGAAASGGGEDGHGGVPGYRRGLRVRRGAV